MINNTQYISNEKQTALKAELALLKTVKIPSIAKRIDEAKQMGDLSENAEYHAAREEMSWAQSRAKELERILDNSEVIEDVASGAQTVGIGSKIVVKMNQQTREFTIVGGQEADPAIGKISNESPLGKAFLGRAVSEKVEVRVPAGVQLYEIIEIK